MTTNPKFSPLQGESRQGQVAAENQAAEVIEAIRGRLDLKLLTRSKIALIGMGGVGSIVAQFVVLFVASLRSRFQCLLVDGDAYSPENAYRVAFPEMGNKAEVQAFSLSAQFGRPGLSLRPFAAYLTEENCREVIEEGDFVLLACDNHATRRLASRRLGELNDGVLISGGNDGVGPGQRGTYGNVQLYGRAAGRDAFGAPLDRFHPEIARPADRRPDELSCEELAQTGQPQLLFANLAVASAMCNALLRLIMPPANERVYDEACLDVLDAVCSPLWLTGPRWKSLPPKPR
jgi:hypothetical protein